MNGREKVTDPKAHWADYGKKFFSSSGWGERKLVLETAIKWANETFGPRDFVRNRMGDYVEREVNEKFPIPKRERVVRT